MAPPISTLMQCLSALALAVLSAGCAETTPQWDRHEGEALRAMLAAQVIDPSAANNANPVAGLDGTSARAALQRYEKAGQEPAAPSLIMQIGAGK